MKYKMTLFVMISMLLTACTAARTISEPTSVSQPETNSTAIPATEANMTFKLASDAFSNGQSIPAKYSCMGKNISPALAWTEPPAGTQSFALIVDDPDAPMGTWVHWVLYNLPASTHSLQENFVAADSTIISGKNSAGHQSYDGPCPPSGTHRYFFKLYALDSAPSLSSGASKEQLLDAMKGHILAQTELMGIFSK
jgi:Raf kinase inhibitor-like YbhB/YbcL family protein